VPISTAKLPSVDQLDWSTSVRARVVTVAVIESEYGRIRAGIRDVRSEESEELTAHSEHTLSSIKDDDE
jgi:hypothetical protein